MDCILFNVPPISPFKEKINRCIQFNKLPFSNGSIIPPPQALLDNFGNAITDNFGNALITNI